MSFNLTAEQERLVAQVRERARSELVPVAHAGRPRRVNRELLKALGELGLSQRLFPRSAGGSRDEDVSAMELCLLREALAAECTAAETALALQGLGSYPILQSGSPEMFGRWLPPVARGEAVTAFALTEPGAGSDAAAISLRAERDGDAWRLSGSKKWISNAPEADVYVVFARTSPDARSRGVTAFVVPGESEGLSGRSLELLGDHPIGSLEFDAVRVPAEGVLGEVDQGFQVAMRTLFLFRPSVGAAAVGMAQVALDAAVEHARARRAFGRELREFQAVSHRLAEMTTRLQAARLLVYFAADSYDRAAPGIPTTSAMAKLFATETAQLAVDAAVQVHGAAALERGHLLEHLYREVRALRIYEGTSEIQREIIARELYR
jgi:acyl-CoA dehydrogenase